MALMLLIEHYNHITWHECDKYHTVITNMRANIYNIKNFEITNQ